MAKETTKNKMVHIMKNVTLSWMGLLLFGDYPIKSGRKHGCVRQTLTNTMRRSGRLVSCPRLGNNGRVWVSCKVIKQLFTLYHCICCAFGLFDGYGTQCHKNRDVNSLGIIQNASNHMLIFLISVGDNFDEILIGGLCSILFWCWRIRAVLRFFGIL